MRAHLVKCRICKECFDTNKLKENADWIMPSRNFYYHKKCYDEWARKKNSVTDTADAELYFDASWKYLKEDVKIDPEFIRFQNQWKSCLKKGMTAKGIYFSLRYFYEIKKGDKDKSNRGIGIIPYIYTEATQYWVKRENFERGVCARIEEQLRQAANQKTLKVTGGAHNQKSKKVMDLSAIAELEDIE